MSKLTILRKLFFALDLSEANFSVRKFAQGEAAQDRLELVAKTVVNGYNVALETGMSDELLVQRQMVSNELCGFFNEGVGMGLYTIDLFSPFKKDRFWNFVKGVGSNHEYMSYIGAGIACGVFFNRPFDKFLEKASPTSGLLILNGFGFYYAYFKPNKIFKDNYIPASVQRDPFFIECYDNGIGRALWFNNGGNPDKIADHVALFPENRRPGVWAGVGLAATYAGGVPAEKIKRLKQLAAPFGISLGEGSLLATHTRDLAGNPHADDTTVQLLTGRSAKDCCAFAREALVRLGNERYIQNKHSLLVFFEDIRSWLISSTEVHRNTSAHQYDILGAD
jgi:enediyne biosynthesis protein E3